MQRLPIPGTPHPTSPKHLTDWNDSGSVLKFLGTHRRHSEGLRASASRSPPRPHQRRAQTASLEPTPRVSRKRRVSGAGLALRSRPQSIPAPRALIPRASKAPSVAPTPQGLPCTSSFENPLIYSFHTFEPGGKPVHRPPLPPRKRPPQRRAAGFNFQRPVPARASASPKPAPGHARAALGRRARCRPRGPSLPRLPPSLSLLPRVSLDCNGRERWAPATPHPSVPDDAGGPGAFGARASGEQNPPVCLLGGGAGPRQASPSHSLSWSTSDPAHTGAHGVGAHANRPPALHKAPGRPQTKRETDQRGWAGGPLLAPTCGRLLALAPSGRGASPSPPPSLQRASAFAHLL